MSFVSIIRYIVIHLIYRSQCEYTNAQNHHLYSDYML